MHRGAHVAPAQKNQSSKPLSIANHSASTLQNRDSAADWRLEISHSCPGGQERLGNPGKFRPICPIRPIYPIITAWHHSPDPTLAVDTLHTTLTAPGQGGTGVWLSAISSEQVHHAIEHAIHYLPSQGPIAVFVHHNTLHAFEHLPFEEAVLEGWKKYGAAPYWPEDRYREELRCGRIDIEDIERVLREDLSESAWEPIVLDTNRYELRLTMLKHTIRNGPDAELRWFIAETDALRKFREDVSPGVASMVIGSVQAAMDRDPAKRSTMTDPQDPVACALQWLYQVCMQGASMVGEVVDDAVPVRRHRDILLGSYGFDCDLRVNEQLVRFLGSVTDQGFAQWGLPERDRSLFEIFQDLYGSKSIFQPNWLKLLADHIAQDRSNHRSSMDSILHSLSCLGLREYGLDDFVDSTLLSLPGWTGMIWQLETNSQWTPRPSPSGSLQDLLAIRLLMDRASLRSALREVPELENQASVHQGSLSMERLAQVLEYHQRRNVRQTVQQRAFILFQLAQLIGWSPAALESLSASQWQVLMDQISACGTMERRRLFHLAYELHYRTQALDAIASVPMASPASIESVSFQVVTCIDDREESLRRVLEQIDPSIETYGAAGFFSVPMYFRSTSDAHYIPLCPVVIKPQHFVDEIGQLSQQELQRRQAEARRVLGHASHRLHISSRSLAAGTLTSLLGSVASLPMVARVLAPRLTSRIREMVSRVVKPNQATLLLIERIETPAAQSSNHHSGHPHGPSALDVSLNQGFTLEEMANMVQRLLGDLGLRQFAKLVFILGHGSSSLNNPHESAYNCGACGGGRGGPNARAFAMMANDHRVRKILESRGVCIPETTCFVGGYHNTCTDSIEYFDVDRLPPTRHMDFLRAQEVFDQAREHNALERSRRFTSASLDLSPAEALRHVEARAEDLAQARPEYNHATNAICFVGRRIRTRGLFMDRRSFLTSYDPTSDTEDCSILTRILQAVIPVCAGISLEYYFSTVDNMIYGCGSKLPHNITSLLGVMEGAASDLRTGLSQQMVEIHEPMRILFVIENTPEAILAILKRNEVLDRLVSNGWVQLASLAKDSNKIHIYKKGGFVPYEPTAATPPVHEDSYACYHHKRGHLPFARLGAQRSS